MSVKKFFSCLMAVIILSICVLPCFAASPSLSVGTSTYQVNPGDVITITVNISSDSGLGTLNFNVNYNTSEFEYVAGSMAETSVFDMAIVNDNTAGSLQYIGISSGVVTKGGSLVSMKFKALGHSGLISINVTDATDSNDNYVKVGKTSVRLSCAHGDMDWEVTKVATCTSKGEESGTCSCGYSATRSIAMTEHKYTDPVVKKPATCTTDGIKSGTCIVCKESGVESKIPATGHNYTDWVVTKQPTIITMGQKERTCLTCGVKEVKEISLTSQEDTTATEPSTNEEPSTENSTLFEPVVPTTEPTTSPSYYEIPTEPQTDPSGGLFGNSDFSESDRAALLVIVLAIVVVIVLVVYILLLRQRKR